MTDPLLVTHATPQYGPGLFSFQLVRNNRASLESSSSETDAFEIRGSTLAVVKPATNASDADSMLPRCPHSDANSRLLTPRRHDA